MPTAESLNKALKHEEVYRQEFRDVAEARVLIGRFLEKTLQPQRLHAALGYRRPEEFESCLPELWQGSGRKHEIQRHGEISSDGDPIEGPATSRKLVPALRENEFPVG